MKKAILSLCMVAIILIVSSNTCFAAVCPNPNAPGGVHHFTDHKVVGGNTEHYDHPYIYGYDHNNQPIYYTCHVTVVTDYCVYVCHYCGLEEPLSVHPAHTHVHEYHSVAH